MKLFGIKFNFLLVVIFCFGFLGNVNASECTEKDIEELKAIAEKITFSREFTDNGAEQNNYGFILTGYNLNKNLILSFPNGLDFFSENEEEKIGYFQNNRSLKIEVYASEHHVCDSTKITTLNVIFPAYNTYSDREECKNKEIDICQKWYDSSDVTEEEFKKIINESNEFEIPEKENKVLKFIFDNRYFLLGSFIIVFIIFVIIFTKRKKNKVKIDL
ncbi:MAG: hypothetical protein PUD59_01585 [bacterium]|nr:hypothetical protein [bacterium]